MILGNSILLKHSSSTPQCALALQRLFTEAGFDQGEFQNVFIDNNQVRHLIKDRHLRGMRFVGSLHSGKQLAELAGENMVKSTFELGGNDPFIVLNDANLPKAVQCAYESRMLVNG